MLKYKCLVNITTIFAVMFLQLSTAVRTLADDGVTPEATAVVTPSVTETAVVTDTPEATPTEEITPAATDATPTEEATPTEAATPAPEETVTPAPEETATPDPQATATPDPVCATPAGSDATPAPTGDGATPECQTPPIVTIEYSDPIWCPDSHTPGDPLCTPAQASITDLINYLQANSATYHGNGSIYFTTGTYGGPETLIVIDYTVLPALGTIGLLGGWDLGGTNTLTGATTFTVPLQVNWNSDVSIADIVVTLPAGSSNTGVFVNTPGNISLDNVFVTGGFSGAELINYTGTGTVTILNSEFSGNANTGLLIYSSGKVTLLDVVANGNNTGIFIDNTTGTDGVDLTNIFVDGNGWTGLDVRSAGDITADNLTASNSTVGANLETTAGNGNIFVSNSTFAGNSSVGLRAIAGAGNVSLINVQTDSQDAPGSFGAWLKSYSGGTVSVTGSVFVNADTGLFVVGTNNVLLTNVTAGGNTGDGATIESGWVFGCFGPDGIAVTVDGGTYQNNGGHGFAVYPGPNGTGTLAGTIAFLANTSGDYLIDLNRSCVPASPDEKEPLPYQVVEVTGQGDDPVQPDCLTYSGVIMILPDQTRVKVECPATAPVTVAAVGKDKLPGAAPNSVTVVSGLSITAGDSGTLPEGSSVGICFAIPAGMEGKHFAIMYWDPTADGGAGGWVELPVNPFTGQVFQLHPNADPADGMLILEGVYQSGNCVCARVNFTGTFILVAR